MIDVNTLSASELSNLFDHTQLKAFASEKDMIKLCSEASKNGFKMVAINSAQTALCRKLLEGSNVHVGAAISFPLGQTCLEVKLFETSKAISDGADEIDYVMNLSELKNGNWGYIRHEMSSIVGLCRAAGVISKVIFENCYLEKEEIRKAAQIATVVRPDFIKTSTGFGEGGALADDVKLMKDVVGESVKIKAAGGIRSWKSCREMLLAGAERIGTSSGVKILEEFIGA